MAKHFVAYGSFPYLSSSLVLIVHQQPPFWEFVVMKIFWFYVVILHPIHSLNRRKAAEESFWWWETFIIVKRKKVRIYYSIFWIDPHRRKCPLVAVFSWRCLLTILRFESAIERKNLGFATDLCYLYKEYLRSDFEIGFFLNKFKLNFAWHFLAWEVCRWNSSGQCVHFSSRAVSIMIATFLIIGFDLGVDE